MYILLKQVKSHGKSFKLPVHVSGPTNRGQSRGSGSFRKPGLFKTTYKMYMYNVHVHVSLAVESSSHSQHDLLRSINLHVQ